MIDQPLMNNIPEGEGFLFPPNSYSHKCNCGVKFLAPKGSLHCHKCLYETIAALRARVESKWISVEDSEPCTDKIYWHTHIKSDGTFTDVYRGGYLSAFKRMGGGGISHAFTHYCESIAPKPPELLESEK